MKFLTLVLSCLFITNAYATKVVPTDNLNIVCSRIETSFTYDMRILDLTKDIAEVNVYDANHNLLMSYSGKNPDFQPQAFLHRDFYGLEFRVYTFGVNDFIIHFSDWELERGEGYYANGNFKVHCNIVP